MKIRSTQRMLLQLARDTEDEQLDALMTLSGEHGATIEKFRFNAIGYFKYLIQSRTLSEFRDFIKEVFRKAKLETLRKIVEAHERDCQEDDLQAKPLGDRPRSCEDRQLILDFVYTTFKMAQHFTRRHIAIMTAVSNINESEKAGVMNFTDLCTKLKQCGCISETNVEYLKDLLAELRLEEPLTMLLEYENNILPPPSNNQRTPLHRQGHVERPSPSLHSGGMTSSRSLPEYLGSTGSSSSIHATPGGSSSYATPPQGDASLHYGANQYRKTMSVPGCGQLSRQREEMRIPHDPTYPGGYNIPPSAAMPASSPIAGQLHPVSTSSPTLDQQPSAPSISSPADDQHPALPISPPTFSHHPLAPPTSLAMPQTVGHLPSAPPYSLAMVDQHLQALPTASQTYSHHPSATPISSPMADQHPQATSTSSLMCGHHPSVVPTSLSTSDQYPGATPTSSRVRSLHPSAPPISSAEAVHCHPTASRLLTQTSRPVPPTVSPAGTPISSAEAVHRHPTASRLLTRTSHPVPPTVSLAGTPISSAEAVHRHPTASRLLTRTSHPVPPTVSLAGTPISSAEAVHRHPTASRLLTRTSRPVPPTVSPVSSHHPVQPSAPPRHYLAQSTPPFSDAQVVLQNRPVHGPTGTSSHRVLPPGLSDSSSQSGDLSSSCSRGLSPLSSCRSSLSTYQSNGPPEAKPIEVSGSHNHQVRNSSSASIGNQSEASYRQENSSESMSSRFCSEPHQREHTGPCETVSPPLSNSHGHQEPPRNIGVHAFHSRLFPSNYSNNGTELHSSFNSSLRSSEVVGYPSSNLSELTMSERGNPIGQPDSYSNTNSGLLGLGQDPMPLPRNSYHYNGASRKRSSPPVNETMVGWKKIKTEDYITAAVTAPESDEDFQTPPTSPQKKKT